MEKETLRIEGFSDGVFAIAVTLLVLDLHFPEENSIQNGNDLLVFLKNQWPAFLAFILSFFSIFIMWVNHHKIFKQIYSQNSAIMFANGLILSWFRQFLILPLCWQGILMVKRLLLLWHFILVFLF
jgi:uncharacterized membrane protein